MIFFKDREYYIKYCQLGHGQKEDLDVNLSNPIRNILPKKHCEFKITPYYFFIKKYILNGSGISIDISLSKEYYHISVTFYADYRNTKLFITNDKDELITLLGDIITAENTDDLNKIIRDIKLNQIINYKF